MSTERLIAFIERQIERGVDVFVLVRVGSNGGEVDRWNLKEQGWGGPDEIAQAVEETASESLAQTPGERAKFLLQPYTEGRRGASYPLPVVEPGMAAMVAMGGDAAMTGYANPASLGTLHPMVAALVQSQTHSEHMHRLALASAGSSLEQIISENRELREENRRLMRQHAKEAADREAFMQAKHERDMDHRREKRREDRRDKIVEKVIPLFPMVASKWVGKPMKEGAMMATLKGFGDSLSEDQIQGLMGILTVEQRIILGHVIGAEDKDKAAAEEKRKAEEAEKKAGEEAASKEAREAVDAELVNGQDEGEAKAPKTKAKKGHP